MVEELGFDGLFVQFLRSLLFEGLLHEPYRSFEEKLLVFLGPLAGGFPSDFLQDFRNRETLVVDVLQRLVLSL